MSKHLETMPILPLDMVIFPFSQNRIHITDPNLIPMIEECIRFEKPIAIVLIRNHAPEAHDVEPYLVGTAAQIKSVDRYDNGRMDIQILGDRRIRIREIFEDEPYLTGNVEPVVEAAADDESAADALFDTARSEFEDLMKRLFSRQDFQIQVVFPSDPFVLSFTIANFLPLDNLSKQNLLEMTSTSERFRSMIPFLQTQCASLDHPGLERFSSLGWEKWTSLN